MHALNATCLPLGEDEPLPPSFDRVAMAKDLLGELYRAERKGLLRFLSRRATTDAEDIVQQIFVRMAASPSEHVAAITAPTAYLRQGARNVVRDEARAAARNDPDLHVPLDEVSLSEGDPVAALEARDMLARLEQAVLRLKPLTRQIFLARRLDGYSYAEIARETGLSVRGVEKQMSRAIKQLGRHLRRHE